MYYRITPSRLDGLDAQGRKSPNPFGPRGDGPSFFRPIIAERESEAMLIKERIEQQSPRGAWVAYVDEIDPDAPYTTPAYVEG